MNNAIPKIPVTTITGLLNQAKFRNSFDKLPKGKTYQDLSTVIIIPTRGTVEEKSVINCKKCKTPNEYIKTVTSGLSSVVVQSWRNMIRPMNVPVIEMMIPGMEVGAAYNTAVEMILNNPLLAKFKYLLTMEDDNIIPFIPNSHGPLMHLYEDMNKYDVAGGLYWTKGTPSMPLIFGDPKQKSDNKAGMFKVRHDWSPGKVVECNGLGMGFTLYKMDIFKDTRLERPFFKTVFENTENSQKMYTQDLFFFEKIRKLGYRVCVDTRVILGHLDNRTGVIY